MILLPELRTISGFVAVKTANTFFLKDCAICNGPESQQITKSLSLTNLIKSLEDLLVFLKKKLLQLDCRYFGVIEAIVKSGLPKLYLI